MAEVSQDSGSHKKGDGKQRAKKASTRIDFTPMVDLGFLLITFFMLTTSMIKQQTMEITMPSDKKVTEENQTVAKASQAVTLILAKENKVFYYFGQPNIEGVKETDYSSKGLRSVLLEKNYEIAKQVEDLKIEKTRTKMAEDIYRKQLSEIKAGKNAPVVRIMATDDATYKNLVDALDEMNISSISRYAIVDLDSISKQLVDTKIKL